MTKSLIIGSSILVTLAVLAEQGWRGIVPLHSTRSDVERLIGAPMKPGGMTYDLKNERVNVRYASVPCMKGWPYGWKVPAGTVTSIEVFPKRASKLSDLQIDLSKYKRLEDPHLSGEVYYNSLRDGLSIRIEGDDVVSFQYFPPESERYLMCPEAAARQTEIERGESASICPTFYYIGVSPSEERIRLEIFADQLNRYSADSKIYIIGYAGRQPCQNEALLRAGRARDYLLKVGIRKERILIIDGGYKTAVWNEIYVVEPGKPKPLADPDIYPGDVHLPVNCPHD